MEPQVIGAVMDSSNIPTLNNLKITNGEIKTPFLIGVAGGTASGKVIVLYWKRKFT